MVRKNEPEYEELEDIDELIDDEDEEEQPKKPRGRPPKQQEEDEMIQPKKKKARYEAVYQAETLAVVDNQTGEVYVLKQSKILEDEMGSAALKAKEMNELWEIKKNLGV